jgi:tRNA A-37 threonylcarbamoyl transferase component Bud32
LNKLDEAKNQCRQTAEILERKGANAQQSLVDVLVLHSSLHEITGTIDQAEEILLKALKVAIEAFGKVSDEVDEIELSLKNIRRRRRESAR